MGFDCGQRKVVVPAGKRKPVASSVTTAHRRSRWGYTLYLKATSLSDTWNTTSITRLPSFVNGHTACVACRSTWLRLMLRMS